VELIYSIHPLSRQRPTPSLSSMLPIVLWPYSTSSALSFSLLLRLPCLPSYPFAPILPRAPYFFRRLFSPPRDFFSARFSHLRIRALPTGSLTLSSSSPLPSPPLPTDKVPIPPPPPPPPPEPPPPPPRATAVKLRGAAAPPPSLAPSLSVATSRSRSSVQLGPPVSLPSPRPLLLAGLPSEFAVCVSVCVVRHTEMCVRHVGHTSGV